MNKNDLRNLANETLTCVATASRTRSFQMLNIFQCFSKPWNPIFRINTFGRGFGSPSVALELGNVLEVSHNQMKRRANE
jgi:hypothetical protein